MRASPNGEQIKSTHAASTARFTPAQDNKRHAATLLFGCKTTCMNQTIVTFRRTSRLSMRIGKGGTLRVSAPIGIPRGEITRFIESHMDWIERARAVAMENERRREAFFARLPFGTRAERDESIRRIDAVIRPLVEKHSRRMGVAPSAIRYAPTVSRWGCCNVRTGRIEFSVFLLLLPPMFVEHVVVHELAHLIEPSHNARFHAIMDRFFPQWREARAETKRLNYMDCDGD